MRPNLIGLTGRAGAGKDTIGAALVDRHGYARVAFGDAIKRAALDTDPLIELSPYGEVRRLSYIIEGVGWDEAKRLFPDVRRYVQRYGVAVRAELPGCWVNIAAREIARNLGTGRPVVVTDVRFPDEVDEIRVLGGVVIRLDRPDADALGDNAGHVSEQVERLDVDLAVMNVGPPARLASLLNLYARGWLAVPAALPPCPTRKEITT